jgi:hypothetical protein
MEKKIILFFKKKEKKLMQGKPVSFRTKSGKVVRFTCKNMKKRSCRKAKDKLGPAYLPIKNVPSGGSKYGPTVRLAEF